MFSSGRDSRLKKGQFRRLGRAKSRLKEEFTPETASISYEFEAIRATVI
jgi:hypothetical protein